MFDHDSYKWHDHLGDVIINEKQLERLKHVNELSLLEPLDTQGELMFEIVWTPLNEDAEMNLSIAAADAKAAEAKAGVLCVHLDRASGLTVPAASDVYIVVKAGGQEVQSALQPPADVLAFEEEVRFERSALNEMTATGVTLQLMNEVHSMFGSVSHTMLSEGHIKLPAFKRESSLTFTDHELDPKGMISFTVSWEEKTQPDPTAVSLAATSGNHRINVSSTLQGVGIGLKKSLTKEREESGIRDNSVGVLRLHLDKTSNLMAADVNGLGDPYVIVKVGEHEQARSAVQEQTLEPTFNEDFDIAGVFGELATSPITLEFFDKDTFK